MFKSVDKPYNLKGGPLAEQPIMHSTFSGLNTFTYQAAKIWNFLLSRLKETSCLSDVKQWNGLTLFANVIAVRYVINAMLDLCIPETF